MSFHRSIRLARLVPLRFQRLLRPGGLQGLLRRPRRLPGRVELVLQARARLLVAVALLPGRPGLEQLPSCRG